MRKHHNLKGFAALGVAAVVCFGSTQLVAQSQIEKDEAQAETTLRQFWTAFGKADFRSLKSTVDWPCTFMETTSTGAGHSFVNRGPEDFDREVVATAPKAGQEPDFSGLVISQVKVEMVNAGVANVTYECFIPEKRFASRVRRQERLNLVAILRKNKDAWKVVFTGIPM